MTARTEAAPIVTGYRKDRTYWLLGLGFGLLGVSHGATLHHLMPLLLERGLAIQTAVLAASWIGPMQVVGRLAMVATQNRLSSHAVASLAFLAIGCALILLSLSANVPFLLAGFVLLFGAAYGTVSILRPVIARAVLGGEQFGAKSGGLAFIYLTGSAGSAYFGALIWSVGGYQTMLVVLLAITALGGVLYQHAVRGHRSGD